MSRFFFFSLEKRTQFQKNNIRLLFFGRKLRSDPPKPRDGFENHEGNPQGPWRMVAGAEVNPRAGQVQLGILKIPPIVLGCLE